MTKDRRVWLGKQGEQHAKQLLTDKQYRILAENWRCRTGELDFVAETPDGTIVFVEVRTRTGGGIEMAKEAIDLRKRKRVRETANVYMYRHRLHEAKVRFDAVSIHITPSGEVIEAVHVENAF